MLTFISLVRGFKNINYSSSVILFEAIFNSSKLTNFAIGEMSEMLQLFTFNYLRLINCDNSDGRIVKSLQNNKFSIVKFTNPQIGIMS